MRPVSGIGLVVVFPPGGVADVVALVLDSPVFAHVGVQVGGAGEFSRAAGDDEGELLARGGFVETEDVAADTRDSGGIGEVDSGGIGGPGRPPLDPAVVTFLDDVFGFCGQQGQTPSEYFLLEGGLISLHGGLSESPYII